MNKMNERYQGAIQCGRGHKGLPEDWGQDCRQCLRDKVSDLEAENQRLMEDFAKEQEHSDFLERLLEARHGDGWRNLTIAEAERCRDREQRLRSALKKAELALCTCPWPEDAIKTRHLLHCKVVELNIDKIGLAQQALEGKD